MGRPTRPTVAIPLVSAKFPWSRSSLSGLGHASLVSIFSAKSLRSRVGFPGLGQVDKVLCNWVGLGQGDWVSVSPIPVHIGLHILIDCSCLRFFIYQFKVKTLRRFPQDTNLTKWLCKCEGSLQKGKEKKTIIWCEWCKGGS